MSQVENTQELPQDVPIQPIVQAPPPSLQDNLNVLMGVLEENQQRIPEGEYLRGMNALGSLHRMKNKAEFKTGARFMTHEEVCEDDEMFEAVIDVAEELLMEICGSSLEDEERLVEQGEEVDLINQIIGYRPTEGHPGFGVEPVILHHAIQLIYSRIMSDMLEELDNIRQATCKCGWRGTQGNWERHTRNRRHIRWVEQQEELPLSVSPTSPWDRLRAIRSANDNDVTTPLITADQETAHESSPTPQSTLSGTSHLHQILENVASIGK
jgi:hypothetical protein